uniref:Transcription initiation factor TFIID subunit 12 n=1 Tax=Ascaris lumbricoides TaxID=6252 RepID=A0A9J2PD68_ASCLU
MAEYNGQQMNQGYGVGEMGQSPATMQRMQAQHPSPQQQNTHMMQGAQMLPQVPQQQIMTQVPQQQVMAQVSQQQVMAQVPQQQVMVQASQQQMMMQSSQPMQMPACTSMSIHQMAPQMGVTSMIPQQGVALMNQSGQMPQQGGGQGQLVQGTDQMLGAPPSQQQQTQPQTHMIGTSMGQQQMITQMGQQPQQHAIMQPSQQLMQLQPITSQQSMVQNQSPVGFAHPTQPRPPNANYQQTAPLHRLPTPRYPTLSPENVSHNANRGPMTPRVMGQSSAIRQALGHLPSTSSAPCMSTTSVGHSTPPSSSRILEKDVLEALIKSVDPMETVEEDVSEALIQLVDEFVNDLVDQSARVAKHRNSAKMETKDVQFVLEKRMKLVAPPDSSQVATQTAEHNPYAKQPGSEAHRQRMALIKKFVQKP